MNPDILDQLLDEIVPLSAILGGLVFATIWMVMHNARRMTQARAFEESRREIAAYVAEKSISPEQAVALLSINAVDEDAPEKDPGKKLASMINWSEINKKDAAKLISERQSLDEKTFGKAVDLVSRGMPVDQALAFVKARPSDAVPAYARPVGA